MEKKDTVDLKASGLGDILKSIGGFFTGLFTTADAKKQEQGIVEFAVTDLGKLAVDAVEFVAAEVTLKSAGGTAKRDAAVAKLKADAAVAGQDLSAASVAFLNWAIETALQYVIAKNMNLK